MCINTIHRIGLIHKLSIDSHLLKKSVQCNVLLNNCKQNIMSLSLLVGMTVIELVSSKRYKLACASIEDSDQPAHQCSLIRVNVEVLIVAKGPTFLQVEN